MEAVVVFYVERHGRRVVLDRCRSQEGRDGLDAFVAVTVVLQDGIGLETLCQPFRVVFGREIFRDGWGKRHGLHVFGSKW